MNDWQNTSPHSAAASGKSSAAVLVILFLFATPFAAFGVFALVQAARAFRNGQTKAALMACLFGGIFSFFGFGLMFLVATGKKRLAKMNARQTQYPDQPWLWREDWAAGRFRPSPPSFVACATRSYAGRNGHCQ
jgi:hypothetical protein